MESKTTRSKVLSSLSTASFPVLAVIAALVIGAVLIFILGLDWRLAYKSLLQGSLGTKKAIAESLVKTTPLYFTGLSFAIAKRCGLINLGAEGQVYMGGLFAAFIGLSFAGLPRYIHLPLTVMMGFIGGGLLGLITGVLKVRFGASELITGIMFNYIAIKLVSFFVTGPLKEPGDLDQTAIMEVSAQIPRIIENTRLHAGLIIALLCLVFFYIFLWKTTSGYEMRVVGMNRGAAEYSGISISKNVLLAMALAGGFAGLAGCCEVIGVQFRLFQDFSPQYGYEGLPVALLGNSHPVGILLSGLLFGVLKSGSNTMKMLAQVPVAVIQIIQALVIIFVAGREIYNLTKLLRRNKQLEKAGGMNGN
ncbi:MAG: ABC transporter permease [Anaerolineaceae bacterium]|nr:ABC transporter permease [Anaerolineaceae bacterium]